MFINKSAVLNILTEFHIRKYSRNSRSSNDRLTQKTVYPRFLQSLLNSCYVVMLTAVETLPQTYTFYTWTESCQNKERQTYATLALFEYFEFMVFFSSRYATVSVKIVIRTLFIIYSIIFYIYVLSKTRYSVEGTFWLLTQAYVLLFVVFKFIFACHSTYSRHVVN